MTRKTGLYHTKNIGGEAIRAFVPHPLPPTRPKLRIEDDLAHTHAEAVAAIGRLQVAGAMVPSPDWFLYGFVRKEAVVSSQIEGTQATLEDVVSWEAAPESEQSADVEEVCNYVDALTFARRELQRPNGLPLCIRLLCAVHERLMKGTRGSEKLPGKIRTSQNWIGGTRPGNANFVPPPPEMVPEKLAELEAWIHQDDPLPPLVRAGLAHVQFETIHPFLDGNGRVGRLLISLLVEHWGLLNSPLLYLSLGFKRHRQRYYEHLSAVRSDGDWESWTRFFLECVTESADDGVRTAQQLFSLVAADRLHVYEQNTATVTTLKLFEMLPQHPVITLPNATELLSASKPTVGKAIETLCDAGVLKETTGKKRDRIYVYRRYLDVLSEETDILPE